MGAAAGIAVVLAVAQVFSLTRYVSRLPEDTLGIWMHVVTIVLWAIVAVLFFRNWRRQIGKDK
jgi:hypothetical protein